MRHGGVLLHDMISQLVGPREALRALGAHEGPLARVRPVVPLQVRQPQERQVAERALVRLEARVRLHVPPQVLLVEERALARRALHCTGGQARGLLALRLDERLEVGHLRRVVLGPRQQRARRAAAASRGQLHDGRGPAGAAAAASVVLVGRVLVHHHLRAKEAGVLKRRVVVRRVVLARHLVRLGVVRPVGAVRLRTRRKVTT